MRVKALAVLLVMLALLGASELYAAHERGAGAAGPVDVDVDAARDEIARRLLAHESACARVAEQALEAAGNELEPAELFAALETLSLPAGVGVHLFDRYDRMIAWTGSSLRDASLRSLPTDRDGGVFVETVTARQLAVRRQRSSPVDGVAIVAVAHVPIDKRYPVRSPFLRSTSLAREIEAAHRVGEVAILPPDAEQGVALPSAFGGDLARIVVPPLSPVVWREVVEDRAEERRAAIVALCAVAGLVLALAAAPRIGGADTARTWLLRAATVAGLRLVLAFVDPAAALSGSALVDPGVYAGGWPLGLNGSPLALLLTCSSLACIAWFADVAATRVRTRPLSLPAFIAVIAPCALALRIVLGLLVEDVVANSAVPFLPDDSVLPPIGTGALWGALVAGGIAVLATLDALWRLAAPDELRDTRTRLVIVTVVAVLLAPLGEGAAPLHPTIVVTGILGFLVAVGAALDGRGTAIRAAVAPLGLVVGLFAPIQHQLDASLREDLEFLADERLEESEGGREEAELLFVERVLEGLVADEELGDALGGRRLPGELAAALWSRSALSQRTGASGLEVIPLEAEVAYQSFSANMPPRTWLPDPKDFFGPDESWVVGRDGRGLGRDSRWVVGEAPVLVDGGRPVSLRVWLEIRPARTVQLLALTEPRSGGSTATRTPPRPAADRYDADGRLVAGEFENPFTPLRSRLDRGLIRTVLQSGQRTWRKARVGATTFLVLVVPDEQEGERSALAFSTEAAGPRELLLRTTKAGLLGALLAALAVALSAPWWVGGARLRLAPRLVLSYVFVSAIPLLILAWTNSELVKERDATEHRRVLRESVSMLAAALHQPAIANRLAQLVPIELERMGAGVTGLTDFAYSPGRRESVYRGARLVASTDQGLLDTDLFPMRMPGRAYHEVVLQGRAFHVETARAGGHSVDIGYAPLRNPESPGSDVLGAVSVAMVRQGSSREREQAEVVTAVLGLYLVSLIAAMAAGSWLARRLTSPLRELRLATRRVAAGDLSEPVRAAGPGELGQVVEAFNSMTRDLAESREKLVRAEKEAAWRDMARQVAHEVKNPLTPMRLAAEHLRRAHADDSPQFASILQRSVDVIVRQTENLRRIVTDFRDFARMPVKRREPVAMASLVREVLDLFRGVPGLVIEASVADELPDVLADPDEMRRVLVNLAGNAVEALDGAEGSLRTRVFREGSDVVVTLTDDGPGIPADALPRLFEPNFSTKTGGTGLGLAICKRAIDDLGGTITVESEVGHGTTFTIRLPARSRPLF